MIRIRASKEKKFEGKQQEGFNRQKKKKKNQTGKRGALEVMVDREGRLGSQLGIWHKDSSD